MGSRKARSSPDCWRRPIYNKNVRLLITIAAVVAGFAALLPEAHAQLKEREEAPLELPANMEADDEKPLGDPNYVFNPIQARKDVKIGDFYSKKGSHRAAAGRYLEATRWDPGLSEAYWKLGRVREKLEQHQQAIDAYKLFLKLEPGDKRAKEVRERLPELEKKAAEVPDPPDDERPEFTDPKLPRTF
jgi:tetratricopeptide (TPR) repeat protein